jgi:hypothetical protein
MFSECAVIGLCAVPLCSYRIVEDVYCDSGETVNEAVEPGKLLLGFTSQMPETADIAFIYMYRMSISVFP